MRIVKFSSSEARRWRANRDVLVKDDGTMFRYASTKETRAVAEAKLKGVNLRVRDGDTVYSIKPDREMMKRELLIRHGECQVRMMNMTFVAQVRDPNLERPKPGEADRSGPSPEHCQCRKWAGRKPGRHHWTCHWNQYAPADQRGELTEGTMQAAPEPVPEPAVTTVKHESPVVVDSLPTVQQVPVFEVEEEVDEIPPMPPPIGGASSVAFVATPAYAAKVPEAALPVPEPEKCVCARWARQEQEGFPLWNDSGLHHYMCEFFDAWNHQWHPTARLLAADGSELRAASRLEARQAELGQGTVVVDGVTFRVVAS
jgi:hypothetical protein